MGHAIERREMKKAEARRKAAQALRAEIAKAAPGSYALIEGGRFAGEAASYDAAEAWRRAGGTAYREWHLA